MAMGSPLPVSVWIGAQPVNLIVDAAFALTPMGLPITMALSRVARAWLPRHMLTLLDNDRLYRRDPSQMGGGWLPKVHREAMLADMAEELATWQRAWHYGRLAARVFFVGDAHYESVLAEREDSALLPRFEHCAAALDARLALDGEAPTAPLEECARDAVALAAALQPEAAWILTLADGDGPPAPCRMLAGAGLEVRRAWSPLGKDMSELLAAALAPLAARDGQATIVQIAAPGALALPDAWDDGDWSADERLGACDEGQVWRNACALWRPLAAWEAAA